MTLVLLDVDGPLNPYQAERPEGYVKYGHPIGGGVLIDVWLNPAHGPMLLDFAADLDAELVWATAWESEANISIGPRIGLPQLPVIRFGRRFSGAYRDGWWKFPNVLAYAQGRPLVWFDDEFTRESSGDPQREVDAARFLAARGGAPTVLYQVDPRVGLTAADLTAAGRQVREASAT